MCGIVGYIGDGTIHDVLLDGLERLEYRGYDSAGIATLSNAEISIEKVVGKIRDLRNVLGDRTIIGSMGIAHTRWATHGEPNKVNAHPHIDCTGHISVVHNGIIENYESLRTELKKLGHTFKTETDTEVIAHLIEEEMQKDSDHFLQGVTNALKRIEGSFAVGVLFSGKPDLFIVARRKSPLIIGIGKDENFIASDVSAIVKYTKKVIYLNDDEIAVIYKDRVKVLNLSGEVIITKTSTILWDAAQVDKNNYPYYMLKEIHQQPDILRSLVNTRTSLKGEVFFEGLEIKNQLFKDIDHVCIQACGTSYHSGLVGKYLIERFVRIPVEVDISSEFRYRTPIITNKTLLISISQSGETADTIAGLEEAKKLDARTLSLCNVTGSTITRISDGTIYINAGPEIGVASTKAYTAQVATMYLLTLYIARIRKTIPKAMLKTFIWQLKNIPMYIDDILEREQEIKNISHKYFTCNSSLFLGRGINYCTSLEGALKLKEISYVHASGYAAGEMKHGPIALIDKDVPVFCIVPEDSLYDKMVSNIQEVKARKGKIIAIASRGNTEAKLYADEVFYVRNAEEYLNPLVYIIPLQLFSYYIGLMRGCDVDKPRNLAKSVTVE